MRRLSAFGTAAAAGLLPAVLLGGCGAPAGPGPTAVNADRAPADLPAREQRRHRWRAHRAAFLAGLARAERRGLADLQHPGRTVAVRLPGRVDRQGPRRRGRGRQRVPGSPQRGRKVPGHAADQRGHRRGMPATDPVPGAPSGARSGPGPAGGHTELHLRVAPVSRRKDPAKVNVMAYGISSAPKPHGPDACPIFHFFTWPPAERRSEASTTPSTPARETSPMSTPRRPT